MTNQERQLTQEQAVQAIYHFAADQMRQGRSNYQIEQTLIEKGITQDIARTIVNNLAALRTKAIRQAALKSMLIGAAICIVGLVVTIGTYNTAKSSPTGGSYVVAWGAIIFGGYRFLRGLAYYMDS